MKNNRTPTSAQVASHFQRLAIVLLGVFLSADFAAAQRMPQDSWYLAEEIPAEFDVFFNSPRDVAVGPDGNIYVADRYNQSVVVFDSSGRLVRRWAAQDPLAIHVAADGKVYVSSGWQLVQIFDSEGTFLQEIRSPQSGDGQFGEVRGITVDSEGNIYLTDLGTGRVVVYAADGAYLRSWGGFNSEGLEGKFNGIVDVCVMPDGKIAVAEQYSPRRIQIFEPDGSYISEIRLADLNLGLTYLNAVTTDAAGNFLVRGHETWSSQQTGGGTIIILSSAGQLLRHIRDVGIGWNDSAGLAVANDRIYVADQYSHRVIVFNTADGQLLESIGSYGTTGTRTFGLAIDASGHLFLADRNSGKIRKLDPNYETVVVFGGLGTSDGEFEALTDLAVSPDGQRVYAIDESRHRVQIFDAQSGAFLGKFGSNGSGNGQFRFPAGLAVGANGRVYVSDRDNHRVQIFDANGTFLSKFGQEGAFDGYFNSPRGVTVMPNGGVAVADHGNKRIQIFDQDGKFLRKESFHTMLNQGLLAHPADPMYGTPSFSEWDSINRPERIVAATDGALFVFGRAYLQRYTNKWVYSDGYALAAADETLGGLKSWFPNENITSDSQWSQSRNNYDALGPMALTPRGDLVMANGDGTIRVWNRTFRTVQPEPANALSLPRMTSQSRRPGTALVDVEYIVTDPDDDQVHTAALAFKDGGNSLGDVLPIRNVLSGAQLGPNSPTGQNLKFTWDVAKDWSTDFGEVQIEILAKDGRELLNLDFLEIPALTAQENPGGQALPALKISRSPLNDNDLLSVWYWLIAVGDSSINFADGKVMTSDGSIGTVSGLTGEYFENADFTGASFTRNDERLATPTWGAEEPIDGIPFPARSIRWTGEFLPSQSGQYIFQPYSSYGKLKIQIAGNVVAEGNYYGFNTSFNIDAEAGVPLPIVVEISPDQASGSDARYLGGFNISPPGSQSFEDGSAFFQTSSDLLASSSATTRHGREFLFAKMGLREATPEEVRRAREAGNPDEIIQWDPPLQVGPDERPAKINPYGFDTGASGYWVVPVSTSN
jgi:tripartite motif-containing protein 71